MSTAQYNYPISRIFGAGLLNNLGDQKFEKDVKRILLQSGIFPKEKPWDFLTGLKVAYKHLRQNYRCEYVYKNEIANQILLKYHRDNSAVLLNEFGVNQSIADIVIVNGLTAAYEIKTELDNFSRLKGQLIDYLQIFDNVSIVTHIAAVEAIKKLVPEFVGIVVLNKDGKLSYDRHPTNFEDNFNAEIAGRALRQSELTTAYEKYEGKLPTVGTGLIGFTCRKWFASLDRPIARNIFNEGLKSRKPSVEQFHLIINTPKELKILFLGREMRKKDCNIIGHKLNIV